MKIELTAPKNVYGQRQPAGKVLEVGAEIPKWQADKLRETGGAIEVKAKPSKKTKAKAG